jgi:hypothetical protein
MTDLKRLNGGLELIKHIVNTGKQHNQPWSKEKQRQTLNSHKNTKPHRSASKEK